jgi:hypothetical protein
MMGILSKLRNSCGSWPRKQNQKVKQAWCGALFIVCLSTCNQPDSSNTAQYLFVGHPYHRRMEVNQVDERLKDVNFEMFDGLWLGGDVLPYHVDSVEQLVRADSILNIKSPSTLWALGNHDHGELSTPLIEDYTGHHLPEFWQSEGLGVLVLNTNFGWEECEQKLSQLAFIDSTLTHIRGIKSLVVLTHQAIWSALPGLGGFAPVVNAESGGWAVVCEKGNSFEERIWPLLLQARDNGVNVVCVAGDAGTKDSKYHEATVMDIHFILSGIGNTFYLRNKNGIPDSALPDSLVVFNYHKKKGSLSWEPISLNDLISLSKQATSPR